MTKARDLANVISGSGTLNAAVIPALPASKITSGTLGADRVPDLATSKITSGTFADARLSSSSVTQHVDLTALSASNLTSGTVPSARLSLGASDIPALATSKITSGTFADARFAASNITQHVDLSNLNASNLTSGSIPNARVASGAVTQHVSAVTNTSGNWTPSPSNGSFSGASGRYHKIGNVCIAIGHAKFSGRTDANDNQFFINGLPFTSRNDGDAQGWGTVSFRGGTTTNVVIKNNESRVRIYSIAFDLFSTGATSTEYFATALGNETHTITNRNMRQSSNNGSNDHFYIGVCYVTT